MIFFTICFVLFTIGPVFAAASLGGFNRLNDINAYNSKEGIRFYINFTKPIENYSGPVFYEKSIQIDFPNAYLHPSKRSFQIGDELIKEILAYQYKKDVVRVRFVLTRSQYDLDNNFTIDTKQKGVIFSLKYPSDPLSKLLETGAPAPAKVKKPVAKAKPIKKMKAIKKAKASIKKTSSSEAYSGGAPLPGSLLDSVETTEPEQKTKKENSDSGKLEFTTGENTPDLFSTGVKIYGTLFVVLALLFIIVYFVKNYFFKGITALHGEKLVDVIATNHIGAKKAISLVEVAGELIVLGISNNHISMLTRIEDEETIKKLKQHKTRFQKSSPLGGFKFPLSFKKKNQVGSPTTPDFSSTLQSFASDVPEPEFSETGHTAADVTRLIQERLGKMKKSKKIEAYAENVV